MIDLKDLRENPDRYRTAAKQKRIDVDIDRLLQLDSQRRALDSKRQQLTAEKIVTTYVKGFPRRHFECPKGTRNEALDVRVYAFAALTRMPRR